MLWPFLFRTRLQWWGAAPECFSKYRQGSARAIKCITRLDALLVRSDQFRLSWPRCCDASVASHRRTSSLLFHTHRSRQRLLWLARSDALPSSTIQSLLPWEACQCSPRSDPAVLLCSPRKILNRLLLSLCVSLLVANANAQLDANKQLAHDIFKQLIEINTTDSVGNVTTAS